MPKFDTEVWSKTYYKPTAEFLDKEKNCGPSEGMVCQLASIRYLRDLQIDNVAGAEYKPAGIKGADVVAAVKAIKKPETREECEAIVEFWEDLWKQLQKAKTVGFMCNASAAAKAAGFEMKERKAGEVGS